MKSFFKGGEQARKTFLGLMAAYCSIAGAANNNWSLTLNNTSMTWTATETTNSVTLSGSFSRPGSGFDVLNVGAAAGTGAPSIGTSLYTLELPGLAMITNPILTSDFSMVDTVVAGNCPSSDFSAIWVFSQWDQGGSNNMQSDYQPAFGTFTWNNTLSQGTINNVYTPLLSAPIPNFSAFTISGTCSAGIIPIAGVGDRGGTIYMSADGAGFFRTNGNKGIFMFPQVKIVSTTQLAGAYTAYHTVNGVFGTNGTNGVNGSVTYTPMNISVGAWVTGTQNGNIINPSTGATTTSNFANFTINQLNSPANGFLTATLTEGGNHGAMTCAVYYGQQIVFFCAGQNPANTQQPLNLLLVSQNTTFTAYSGNLTGGYAQTTAALDSPNLGKAYLYGTFSNYNGVTSYSLLRLQDDGSIDSTFSAVSTVFSTGVSGIVPSQNSARLGQLYTLMPIASPSAIYRVTTNGSLDTTFAISGVFLQVGLSAVEAIDSPHAGQLYYNSENSYVGRLLTNGASDSTFPVVSSNSYIVAMDVARDSANLGSVYMGGYYGLSTLGSASINQFARIRTNGTVDTTFAPPLPGLAGIGPYADIASILAATDSANLGKVYVSLSNGPGYQYSYGSATVGAIVRVNSNGSLDTTFSTTSLQQGYCCSGGQISMATNGSPGQIYAGIYYGTGNALVRLNTNGSIDSTFAGSSLVGTPSFAQLPGGKFLLTGMTGVAGVGVQGVVMVDSDGSLDVPFQSKVNPGSGLNASVSAMSFAQDSANVGKVYVGGNFSSFNGTPLNYLARFNPNGTPDYSFNQNQSGPSSSVNSIIPLQSSARAGQIYISGYFQTVNGTSSAGAARLFATGSLDSTFTANVLYVYAAAGAIDSPHLDNLYVGGSFTAANSTSVKNIARLLTNGATDLTFNTGATRGANSTVNWIAPAPDSANLGKVYIGGQFTNYTDAGGTHTTNGIARLNSDGSLDAGFVPTNISAASVYTVVPAVDTPHLGQVYVSGTFNSVYAGATHVGLVRLQTNGSADATFSCTMCTTSWSIERINVATDSVEMGKLYAMFAHVTGTGTSPGVVRLNSDGSTDATFAPAGCNVGCTYTSTLGAIAVSPNAIDYGSVYVGGNFSTFNYSNYGSMLVRLLNNGTLN